MSSTIEIYAHWISTRCTMVQLLARHLEVELDINSIGVFPEDETPTTQMQANYFLRKWQRVKYFSGNQDSGVPMMVVNGSEVYTDVSTMLKYIAKKSSQGEQFLYPAESQDVITENLKFGLDVLDKTITKTYYHSLIGRNPVSDDDVEKVGVALGELESLLQDNEFTSENELTLSDFCIAVDLCTLTAVSYDFTKFPKSLAYLSRCKEVITSWDEVAQPAEIIYGKWYTAAKKAEETGTCPYFPRKQSKQVPESPSVHDGLQLFTHCTSLNCAAVRLLACQLDVELELRNTDLFHTNESPENRVKVDENWKTMLIHLHISDNEEADAPPALVDKTEVVVETLDILKYLVEKYSKNEASSSMYLKEDEKRKLIENRASYAIDELTMQIIETYCIEDLTKPPELDPEKVDATNILLTETEKFLNGNDFIAGSGITIADFPFFVNLTTLSKVGHDLSAFPNINEYLIRCKEVMKSWEALAEGDGNMFIQWYLDTKDWALNGNCPYYRSVEYQ